MCSLTETSWPASAWGLQGFRTWRQDFPGGPVVKTLGFRDRRHGFDPWSGN